MKTIPLCFVVLTVQHVFCNIKRHSLKCSDNPKCHCTKSARGNLHADCSSRKLTRAPKFFSNVSSVDLSHNSIGVFPHEGEFPSNLTYLDLSYNNLVRFDGNPFRMLQWLEYLDLTENHLKYQDSIYTQNIFANLTHLKILNLKNNNRQLNTDDSEYPRAISHLPAIEVLRIDGIDGASFGTEYKNLTMLKVLDLSETTDINSCTITYLDQSTFENTPSLTHLNLSRCNIKHISKGTFMNLQNLTHLNLSYNTHLTFRAFSNISYDLKNTDIEVLDVSSIHCFYGVGTILYKSDILDLQSTRLRELYLNLNRLNMFDDNMISYLPKSLEVLSVTHNSLSGGLYFIQARYLTNVRKILAGYQRKTTKDMLLEPPILCHDWRGPETNSNFLTATENVLNENLPHKNDTFLGTLKSEMRVRGTAVYNGVQSFEETGNKQKPFFCFPLPPKMSDFDISDSGFQSIIKEFAVCENNRLESLYVQNNYIKQLIGPVWNMKHLKRVDFSSNLLNSISTFFFDELSSIEYLNLSHNSLGNVLKSDKNGTVFNKLVNLKSLDLSYNRISTLPARLFWNLEKLVYLNLSYNDLENWNVDISNLTHLKRLDLSNNQLEQLGSSARNVLARIGGISKIQINVVNNPLRCNCQTRNFFRWIYKHKHLFYNFQQYRCSLLNNSQLNLSDLKTVLLPYLDKECGNFNPLIVATAFGIIVFVCVVAAGIVYRYRWKLRYLYYMSKNRYFGHVMIRNAKNDDFEYDAFISFSNEERDFVVESLLPELEEENNCRICFHERDFQTGAGIEYNITTALNRSRKTIIILSENYLQSKWCMFEFNMARMDSIYSREGVNVFFLIIYEKIKPRDMPLHMLDMYNSNTYLEYPKDCEEGCVVFWRKLVEAIKL